MQQGKGPPDPGRHSLYICWRLREGKPPPALSPSWGRQLPAQRGSRGDGLGAKTWGDSATWWLFNNIAAGSVPSLARAAPTTSTLCQALGLDKGPRGCWGRVLGRLEPGYEPKCATQEGEQGGPRVSAEAVPGGPRFQRGTDVDRCMQSDLRGREMVAPRARDAGLKAAVNSGPIKLEVPLKYRL